MEFLDFEIRAWQRDSSHLEVLVHSSPVGDMQQPVATPFSSTEIKILCDAFRHPTSGQLSQAPILFDYGQQLSTALLPPPVFGLLVRSLERISPQDGIRIRLCLDRSLVDLPWECLYRPDAAMEKRATGFLALDPRISLVREAPAGRPSARPVRRRQRLLFAGTPYYMDGSDIWQVENQRDALINALKPVEDFLSIATVTSPPTSFQVALANSGVDIFHYAGHADPSAPAASLLEGIRYDPDPHFASLTNDGKPPYVKHLSLETLSVQLRAAGTKLAVLSACNSGRWPIVEPLLRAGLPAVVGCQAWVSVDAALAFCHILYESLAIGLSLDEAATWARLGIVEKASVTGWPMFMVYLPTSDTVLFPKHRLPGVRERQEAARSERQQTISNVTLQIERYIQVTQNIGTVGPGGIATGIESTDRQLPSPTA